jgi:hypothetical protein
LQVGGEKCRIDAQRLDAVAVFDARPYRPVMLERDGIEVRPLVAILRRSERAADGEVFSVYVRRFRHRRTWYWFWGWGVGSRVWD